VLLKTRRATHPHDRVSALFGCAQLVAHAATKGGQ
jgi:hypothetical protein